MTSPRVQGASHVLSECSDAGPSYSVESVQSRMGSKKLIPSPPHVEDILDWEWVNTEFKSDIAPQSQKMILGVDSEVSPPILLVLNLTHLKSHGIRLW